VVDATSMAIFWTIAYTAGFVYTSRSLDAAAREILLGGVYGRFSDWFRLKLGAT
jgi:hypothetical protein